MNWRHLVAIIQLRWRLGYNRIARSGSLGQVLAVLLTLLLFAGALAGFVLPLLIGARLLPRAAPHQIMFLWTAAAFVFLLFWLIGVLTELQRSEPLSLDKLLHLPVSPRGAFLLNYLGSFASVSVVICGPAMFGLTCAMVLVGGPRHLLLLPLFVSFLVMVTALTYQFRGWIAGLMLNKRRRGTIIAVFTLSLVALGQTPNLLHWSMQKRERAREARLNEQIDAVESSRQEGQLNDADAEARIAELETAHKQRTEAASEQRSDRMLDRLTRFNAIAPVGWLPYGAAALARGEVWPALAGSIGALGIGLLSLSRAYRTTLRIYTGGLSAKRPRKRRQQTAQAPRPGRRLLLEWQLPWIAEQTAIVALATFRGLTRSPQVKLLLATPILLLIFFGWMLFNRTGGRLPGVQPSMAALGAVFLSTLCLTQLMQNMFGFDRDGFRAFVLAPIERSRLLFGKNLAVGALAVPLGLVCLLLVRLAVAIPLSHLVASIAQIGNVFVLASLAGNFSSTVAPFGLAEGAMKPAHPTARKILMQLLTSLLFPLAMLPATLPLGLEMLFGFLGIARGVPLYLIVSLVELLLLAAAYRPLLELQGRFLQRRERRVLAEVASKL